MKKAKWLSYCLEIGWDKKHIDKLAATWDEYYNENGIKKPINIQEQPQKLPPFYPAKDNREEALNMLKKLKLNLKQSK